MTKMFLECKELLLSDFEWLICKRSLSQPIIKQSKIMRVLSRKQSIFIFFIVGYLAEIWPFSRTYRNWYRISSNCKCMEQPTNFCLRKVPSDPAIIEVLTNSQSFPTKIEAKLCIWKYFRMSPVIHSIDGYEPKLLEFNV